jgi:hypothetical protein
MVAKYGPQILLMFRVRLVHWNAEEAAAKVELLRVAGYDAVYGGEFKDWKRDLVDAIAIDLSRLPSHGREVATAWRGSKATRQIPIFFVEGAPEKVEAMRQVFPDAIYTTWPRLTAALKRVKPLENPVVPTQMMDRYAGRTTAQKLGVKENSMVTVVDPPRDYLRVLGDLPEGVEVSEDPGTLSPVTVCFVRDAEGLPNILAFGRKIAGKSKFWVCWPKGKKQLVSGDYIRNCAINLGLVDYKICSVDATWSGMVFAVKKL